MQICEIRRTSTQSVALSSNRSHQLHTKITLMLFCLQWLKRIHQHQHTVGIWHNYVSPLPPCVSWICGIMMSLWMLDKTWHECKDPDKRIVSYKESCAQNTYAHYYKYSWSPLATKVDCGKHFKNRLMTHYFNQFLVLEILNTWFLFLM